jgi:hypothetical protein
MVADLVTLLLAACGGMVLAEFLRYLSHCLLGLVTEQVVLIGNPLVLRLVLFAVLGMRLSSDLSHLAGALDIMKVVMP